MGRAISTPRYEGGKLALRCGKTYARGRRAPGALYAQSLQAVRNANCVCDTCMSVCLWMVGVRRECFWKDSLSIWKALMKTLAFKL